MAFSLPAYSTSYTHNLNYTHQTGDGNTAQLTGRVTFDSSFGSANDHFGEFGAFTAINRNLITDITFSYTPFGGSELTLVATDIVAFRLDHVNNGSTDYSSANIMNEFSVLQFRTAVGDSDPFALIQADDNFALQAGENDDFELDNTTYHSPGPLPLLGLFTAFSSMKTLKSKYKKKYNL